MKTTTKNKIRHNRNEHPYIHQKNDEFRTYVRNQMEKNNLSLYEFIDEFTDFLNKKCPSRNNEENYSWDNLFRKYVSGHAEDLGNGVAKAVEEYFSKKL